MDKGEAPVCLCCHGEEASAPMCFPWSFQGGLWINKICHRTRAVWLFYPLLCLPDLLPCCTPLPSLALCALSDSCQRPCGGVCWRPGCAILLLPKNGTRLPEGGSGGVIFEGWDFSWGKQQARRVGRACVGSASAILAVASLRCRNIPCSFPGPSRDRLGQWSRNP